VSGSNAPRFRVNPNTGDAVSAGTPRIATTTLTLTADSPTSLTLPVANGALAIDEGTTVPPDSTSGKSSGCGCAASAHGSFALLAGVAAWGLLRSRRRR